MCYTAYVPFPRMAMPETGKREVNLLGGSRKIRLAVPLKWGPVMESVNMRDSGAVTSVKIFRPVVGTRFPKN